MSHESALATSVIDAWSTLKSDPRFDDAEVRTLANEIGILCAIFAPRIKRMLELQERLIDLKKSDIALDEDFEKFARMIAQATNKLVNADLDALHEMSRHMLQYKLPLPVDPRLESVA